MVTLNIRTSLLRCRLFICVPFLLLLLKPCQADPWIDAAGQITSTGRVGIGTANPSYKLDVRGGGGFIPFLQMDNGGSIWEVGSDNVANGFYVWKSGSGYKMVVNNSGNVGIGTTSPAYKLDVRGGGAFIPFLRMDNGGSTWEVGSDNVANGFYVWKSGGGYKMVVNNSGNVGIGTTSPAYKLDVRGGGGFMPYLQMDNGGSVWEVGSDNTAGGFYVYKNGSGYKMVVNNSGKVGIGTNTPSELLEVAGNIKGVDLIASNSIKIKNWKVDAPDYVFDKQYKLRPLSEVEKNIKTNKHLPDVPSAKEFKENGVDILKMNYTLLQKVEELTLYAIEQEKRINRLEKAIGKGGR